MTDITEAVDAGDIEDAKFLGKRIGDMERQELYAVIQWLCEENETISEQKYNAEKSKAELMKDMAESV